MRVTSSAIAGALSTSTLNGFTGSLPVDGLYLPNVYREDARISKIVPLGDNPARKMYFNFAAFNLSTAPNSPELRRKATRLREQCSRRPRRLSAWGTATAPTPTATSLVTCS